MVILLSVRHSGAKIIQILEWNFFIARCLIYTPYLDFQPKTSRLSTKIEDMFADLETKMRVLTLRRTKFHNCFFFLLSEWIMQRIIIHVLLKAEPRHQ